MCLGIFRKNIWLIPSVACGVYVDFIQEEDILI